MVWPIKWKRRLLEDDSDSDSDDHTNDVENSENIESPVVSPIKRLKTCTNITPWIKTNIFSVLNNSKNDKRKSVKKLKLSTTLSPLSIFKEKNTNLNNDEINSLEVPDELNTTPIPDHISIKKKHTPLVAYHKSKTEIANTSKEITTIKSTDNRLLEKNRWKNIRRSFQARNLSSEFNLESMLDDKESSPDPEQSPRKLHQVNYIKQVSTTSSDLLKTFQKYSRDKLNSTEINLDTTIEDDTTDDEITSLSSVTLSQQIDAEEPLSWNNTNLISRVLSRKLNSEKELMSWNYNEKLGKNQKRKKKFVSGGLLEQFYIAMKKYRSETIFWEFQKGNDIGPPDVEGIIKNFQIQYNRVMVYIETIHGKNIIIVLELDKFYKKKLKIGSSVDIGLPTVNSNPYKIRDNHVYLSVNKIALKRSKN